jgi:hypothetical protein
MRIIQSRRDFLASPSATGAGVLGARSFLADEPRAPNMRAARDRHDRFAVPR